MRASLLGGLLVAALAAPGAGSEHAPGAGAAERSGTGEACGPFEGPHVFAQLPPSDEPGITPSPPSRGVGSPAGGQIITLPPGGGDRVAAQIDGEALVALPKDDSGAIPTDLEIAPHANVVESYFSPVLCATVARIVGRPGDTLEELVPGLPDTAALVPNHVYRTAQAELRPLGGKPAGEPDPYRRLQWGFDQTGVEQARSLSDGAGVRVAVLDSAPQRDHRDLSGIELELVEGGPSAAPGAHGTLITGIVNAVPNNGFGIAGLAPGAQIVSVPVCTPAGATASDVCPLFTLLKGLDRAWQAQADLFNLSIVGPANPLLERGMTRLEELGVLVVAASGNEGTSKPRYPAAYPSVIGVGALDREGKLWARSNGGPSAEILAPGVEVLSTVPGDAFSFGSGTSFSAAHVTGSLAVLIGAGTPPPVARTALFQQAGARAAGPGAPSLPPVCDVFERLGIRCASSSSSSSSN